MAKENRYWGTKKPNHIFWVFVGFVVFFLLWLSYVVSLLTSRIYKMRSLLTHWGLPLLTRKKSNQPIHHHCELTSSIGGCSFWFLPQTWIQVSFELIIVVYFPCWVCNLLLNSAVWWVDKFCLICATASCLISCLLFGTNLVKSLVISTCQLPLMHLYLVVPTEKQCSFLELTLVYADIKIHYRVTLSWPHLWIHFQPGNWVQLQW